jgi:hypothetical protein
VHELVLNVEKAHQKQFAGMPTGQVLNKLTGPLGSLH